MSLRIRANGTIVCAAQSAPEPGDCYLDDAVHARLAGAEPNSLHVLVTDDEGETWHFVAPPKKQSPTKKQIILAEEIGGDGERNGWLVTLDCGHKKATRTKSVEYECGVCNAKALKFHD